ncbi:MerR family transcriptional regulator [Nocardia sp. alder85J]|uniref:MerR family transcriptional regulator n=1 Tax=Nocardia sp. alder85J TaxID=2862949 RepID=UPI001CD4EB2E|nr:MerR family transcriptional regulator [Nocardia sp. alder85J]MCX4091986.1 MerR family transcriptional regulator [Nocardia sp. alder85J]
MSTGTSENAPPRGEEPSLGIAQVAERTGLSIDTLRYYEKAGLIEPVGRTSGNQRRYRVADLDWLDFLLRLRETGMSIADMQRFAVLRAGGDPTIAQRLAMLREHRDDLEQRIRDLRRNATALDRKIDDYVRMLIRQPGGENGK